MFSLYYLEDTQGVAVDDLIKPSSHFYVYIGLEIIVLIFLAWAIIKVAGMSQTSTKDAGSKPKI